MSRLRKTRPGAALVCLVVLASACGEATTGSATPIDGSAVSSTTEPLALEPNAAEPNAAEPTNEIPATAAGELAFGLQRCDPEMPLLAADPTFYRDQPVYVGNEQPSEEIRAWATRQSGYEGIWIDRDHNGWVSVGFSQDAPSRQIDLEAEFPGVGVVAVAVTATDAELVALRDDVGEALEGFPGWGIGHSVPSGMVEVSVPVLDDETLGRLASLAGPMLCVSGLDPAVAVQDGPQLTEGVGWRLLGSDRTGSSYRTGIATTPDQLRELWQLAGLGGDAPDVDFENEIVIWFGAVYGSGCPIRMDDVIVDTEAGLIHPDFVMPGNPVYCASDANAEAYVVALDRSRLPETPFDVQLDADEPPRGAPEERTTVIVDLRPPGATASASDLIVASLEDNEPARPDRFVPGYVIEEGYPWTLLLDLACSVDLIGELNGVAWLAVEPRLLDGPPPAWTEDTKEGFAVAEFLLMSSPARLTITVNGTKVAYEPIPAGEESDMSCE